jgi:hypothetical protein
MIVATEIAASRTSYILKFEWGKARSNVQEEQKMASVLM